MKKILKIFTILLLLLPLAVKAESLGCYAKIYDVINNENFNCNATSCDNLTYKDEKDSSIDYKDYFTCTEIEETNKTKFTVKNTLKFASSQETGHVVISDGTNSSVITIKNEAYVKQTTTALSTTTTTVSGKAYTVTLDPNNGEKPETKSCSLTGTNETCTVTLPTKTDTKFTGWGKAKTCTTGNTGSVKVNEDVTYYACYNTNNSTVSLTLNSLKLKNNNEIIDIGIFSKKKFEYSAKVLNNVENLIVDAIADEGITVTSAGIENLSVGENIVKINLTDKDKNTSEYKIIVTRLKKGETISNINYLKSLVIGGNYNINFNKETFIYNLEIPSDVDSLEITPVAEDETIVPEVKNKTNLKNGSVIEIVLKSENGNKTIYKINIIKKQTTSLILFGAAAVIIFLIILLIIMIIIKSNKKNKTNLKNNIKQDKKNKKDDEIEILDI